MVDVLKQFKNTKRVNEILQNEFNERKNHDKINLPQLLKPTFNEFIKKLIPRNMEKLVKILNRSNIFFVLNFEPIMIGIP